MATRKPRLLFRLSGVLSFRLAARRFRGLLFQEPPRTTRQGTGQAAATPRIPRRGRSPHAAAMCLRDGHAQSMSGCASWLGRGQPSRCDSGRADRAGGCGTAAHSLRAGDAARPGAEQSRERSPGSASTQFASCRDATTGAAEPNARRFGPTTRLELPGRRQQRKVVDIAQIWRARHLFDEMIEPAVAVRSAVHPPRGQRAQMVLQHFLELSRVGKGPGPPARVAAIGLGEPLLDERVEPLLLFESLGRGCGRRRRRYLPARRTGGRGTGCGPSSRRPRWCR